MQGFIQLESDESSNVLFRWFIDIFTDIIEKLGAKNIQVGKWLLFNNIGFMLGSNGCWLLTEI